MEISRSNSLYMNQSNTDTTKKSSLSVEDFLQIMAAEIKNQSPMGSEGGGGGGSKTDYISQLAQFTTLEQITSITESMSLLTMMNQQQYSFSLIGKEVTIASEDGNISGIVDRVKFENGFALIQVNNKNYNLGSVLEVANYEVKVEVEEEQQ
mgnify:CR=1 FL=1